jgi:hypothetical protein
VVTPGAPVGTAPSGSGDQVAAACRNGPTEARVVALLRDEVRGLPAGARIRTTDGPRCAGEWHWTMLEVTGHERLQVVTRGRVTAPELVTAGTDVCSPEVETGAPAGIRALACDPVPGA